MRAPLEHGLSVGQRCEVVFSEARETPGLSSFVGETLYATVVRTTVIADGSHQLLGVGMRFDQPLFL